MNNFNLFEATNLKKILNKRTGETKFGEQIKILSSNTNIYEQLKRLDVLYVIFGISEDVGVFANFGKSGTSTAWDATIKILLNIQDNSFTNAKNVAVLGHFNFKNEMKIISELSQNNKNHIKKARELTAKIDKNVTQLVHDIVKAGKIPIIIGGGHNNAYGNIKGSALALNQPINAINFDAHTDFRREEGRHSGNGFSYSFTEGFLKRYFIFGLHENYTSQNIFNTLNKLKSIDYNTFESIEVRGELKFKNELKRALQFINTTKYGIEIDCDAIENISSSAQTPSGFSVTKTRRFLHYFAKQPNATYLHICEAAPKKKQQAQIGKLITYLITDFIKANSYKLDKKTN